MDDASMSYKLVESQPIVQRTSASFVSRKTQRTPLVRPSPTSSRSYRSLVRCGRLAYHAISNFNSVRMSRYGTRGVFTSLFYADAPTPAAAFRGLFSDIGDHDNPVLHRVQNQLGDCQP